MNDIEERDIKLKKIYDSAYKFLIEICPKEIKDLNMYFNVEKNFKSKKDILYRLLLSLQNRQRSSNVIGLERKERIDIFDNILFHYDSKKILSNYNADSLFDKFGNNFVIKNKESRNNLWKLYAKSVISACEFIEKFEDEKEFDEFAKIFSYNSFSSAALPMLLEKEIIGLGFPLACDFLKELGFKEYPKPDVHIKDIFAAFNLCDKKDYEVYKTVIEMANIVNESPYKVDKIFWLIGSGNFYLDNINIGRNKEKFINKVLNDLNIG